MQLAKLKENSTILKSTGEEIIATNEEVDKKLLTKADKTDLPSKLSQLTKDVNFDERYYTETESDAKYEPKVHVGTTPPSDNAANWIDTSL